MSFIESRPLLVKYLEHYSDEQNIRYNVLPGISGWTQINGQNDIDWDYKFKLDMRYIHNISFKLDCKIFLLLYSKSAK